MTSGDGQLCQIMAILNVTPDSFSDGGDYLDPKLAAQRGIELMAQGAHIIDVGGESTRPGAVPVSAEEEWRRIGPVVGALVGQGIPVSVDTTKSRVARQAIDAGARFINDISGGRFDSDMWTVAQDAETYILGHVAVDNMEGIHVQETEVISVGQLISDLRHRLNAMPEKLRRKTWVDPCVGFGKDDASSAKICASIQQIEKELGCSVLLGASRKRFVSSRVDGEVSILQRDWLSVGVTLASVLSGAKMVRVHNVPLLLHVLAGFQSVYRGGDNESLA